MAKIVKKKKLGLGDRGRSSGGSGVETSSLRPRFVPRPAPCGFEGCPNHNPIRKMLMTISKALAMGKSKEQAFAEAWTLFAEMTPFPSVCGRVCPHPCETVCNRKDKEGAVGINAMERFIGDYALKSNLKPPMLTDTKRAEKIAVIGAGPAGLSCAYHLARRGYGVTVFEAFPKAGGMLRYGIPDYRLPQDILDAEIKRIADMGVEIKLNSMIGKDVQYTDLQKEYKAVFVGIGAHTGLKLKVEGEDAPNVMTGVDLLHRVNAGEMVDVGDHVVVIGGGDTAIDAARIARRLGAQATILYRRTREEMPAINEEIEGALAEGVRIDYLAAPIEIYTAGGKATGAKCQRMELGEPDSSGRRRPVPKEGDTYDLQFSTLVTAISQAPDFTGFNDFIEGRDWIKVDEKYKTKIEAVFSGGDNTNLGLVIDAIYHGRCAAEAIDELIAGNPIPPKHAGEVVRLSEMAHTYYEAAERNKAAALSPEDSLKNLTVEIAATFTEEQALAEAKRCMSCGMCFDCGTCWSLCQDNAIVKPLHRGGPVAGGEEYKFKLDFCNGCKKCAENCPCGFIKMF